MTDLSLHAPAPYTPAAGTVNGSIDDDPRRGDDRTLIIPIGSAAVMLLVIDLSIALRWNGGDKASATLAASAVGLLASSIGSDTCRSSDSRLDRTAMQVLLAAP